MGLAAFTLGSDAAGQRHCLIFLSEIIADRDLTAIAHYGQKRSVADTHPTADCRAFCRCGRGQNVRLQVPADIEIDRPGGQGQQEQQAESGQRPEGAACRSSAANASSRENNTGRCLRSFFSFAGKFPDIRLLDGGKYILQDQCRCIVLEPRLGVEDQTVDTHPGTRRTHRQGSHSPGPLSRRWPWPHGSQPKRHGD